MRFIDTNIALYAVSVLPEDVAKRRIARQLLEQPELAVSVQVLQEFYYRATHPGGRFRLSHEAAMAFLETLLRYPVQSVTIDVFRAAVSISQRFQISYWDGAILAAARALGCEAVYSEDLSHGQDYGGTRVFNPFRDEVEVR